MNTVQNLERRLAVLERTNRRYQIIIVAAVVALSSVGLIAGRQGVVDLVQTKRLEILDDAGNVVVSSEANKDGGGRVSVQNSSGMRVVNAMCNKEGNGELSVNDNKGLKAFEARSTMDGGRMGMYNSGGSTMLEFTIEEAGGALLAYNMVGEPIGKLGGTKLAGKGKVKTTR